MDICPCPSVQGKPLSTHAPLGHANRCVFLTSQTDPLSGAYDMHTHKHTHYTLQHTEPEKDTVEPEGPVLLDSSKTIQHGFMQNKYMSLPPQEGSSSMACSFVAFQGNQGDPSKYSAWGTVGIMTGGEGDTVDS